MKFLAIGQNYQGRKYAHVFPWGQKHTVGLILSQLKNFEFPENLRFKPGRTLAMRKSEFLLNF